MTILLTFFSSVQHSDLLSNLEALKEENVRHGFLWTGKISAISSTIQHISRSLPDLASAQDFNDLRISFQRFATQLSDITRLQTAKRDEMLLESLCFSTMELRRSNISPAHARTFDWIFDTHLLAQSDPRSTIQLASWLEYGEEIYWVSGKPGKKTLRFLVTHQANDLS